MNNDNEPQRERTAVVAFLGACKDAGMDPDKVFQAIHDVREAAFCLCTGDMDSGYVREYNPDCPVHGDDAWVLVPANITPEMSDAMADGYRKDAYSDAIWRGMLMARPRR